MQKENTEAALIFAEGYQNYPESAKAPDSLFKLSEALFKINKINESCETLNQFIKNYPKHQLIEKAKAKINQTPCN